MTAYVTDARGVRLQLPVLLGWELDYTTGTPCDSFWLCCPWLKQLKHNNFLKTFKAGKQPPSL